MDPDRQERIAQGIALLEQGHSYREASAIVDIPTTTLDRWAERSGADIEQLAERIRAKAANLAEKAVKRMERDIDVVDDRYVATWAHTGAKLAGILDQPESSAAQGISELVDRLTQAGNTVSVGVKVEKAER